MFEALRKYRSVLILVLMGLVMVCFVADESCDAQHFAKHTAASTCMTAIAEDFDIDDDEDDEVANIFAEDNACASIPMLEAIGQRAEGSKCSLALLRGQVRRHSPRNNLPYSHNYVILRNTESGVDLFHAAFFVLYFFLHNPERGSGEPGSRSIFQTTNL